MGIVPESESPPSYLTCAEYLDFVCRIRGVKEIDAKVKHWLEWFGIEDKRETLCKDLSKRTASESDACRRIHSRTSVVILG